MGWPYAPAFLAAQSLRQPRVAGYVRRQRARHAIRFSWHDEICLAGYTKGGSHLGADKARNYSVICLKGEHFPKPIVLLTNKRITNKVAAQRIVSAYFDRWGIEEAFRFAKCERHGFSLEDMRLLTWVGLRRIVLFVLLLSGFLPS